MKKSYTEVMKDIKDANHMVLHAGTEKVKQVWVDRREKLDDCLACPVLGRECPPGCKSL
jgi:type II secretory pathway component PulL